MRDGLKNRNKIHLSQKRTCGRYDRAARVFSGCIAENKYCRYENESICSLGYRYNPKTMRPLEPCLKPTTGSQYVRALELFGKVRKI
jgi:hypothetical protein